MTPELILGAAFAVTASLAYWLGRLHGYDRGWIDAINKGPPKLEMYRLRAPDGTLREVDVRTAASLLQDPGWRVAVSENETGRVYPEQWQRR